MHGLSTAYHLAKELKARGLGSGADIVVLDKSSPGSGASGIACGVVRNNYFQPAMSELMQACVEVWESDPAAYHYNPVGYLALGATVQESDLVATYERQEQIGYRSELIVGPAKVDAAHEARSSRTGARKVSPSACTSIREASPSTWTRFAASRRSAKRKASRSSPGSRCEDLEFGSDDVVTAVRTTEGRIGVGEQLVLAPGPWAKQFWAMLGLPMQIDIRTPSGEVAKDRPMWTYWNLQEGEVGVDPLTFATADGGNPPVIHLDTDAPLYTDDGKLVTDELWGIYFKRDRHGVQGGASPLVVEDDVELDPYPQTTNVDPEFPDMWCAGLSHAMSRFAGLPRRLQERPLRRCRRVHRRQLPRLRLREAERLRDSRLEPRVQDDRSRPRGCKGRRRRAFRPALSVPLRAFHHRRPAPGLALALSLVIDA